MIQVLILPLYSSRYSSLNNGGFGRDPVGYSYQSLSPTDVHLFALEIFGRGNYERLLLVKLRYGLRFR